jgi:hypothetical protein
MERSYLFKDVWLKNDAEVERDAIAAWTAADALLTNVDPRHRAKELCVVCYDGQEVIGISTCTISYLNPVRQKMVLFRIFIAPNRRQERIAVPLTRHTFEVAERYALANPQLRLGGLGAVVVVEGYLHGPVTAEKLILIGYTQEGHPIIVKWFDHFVLDPITGT